MQTSSVAAAAALTSGEAKVAHRLLINWPGGIHTDMSATVVSAEPEADLVSDMPEDTRDPVGYQSRSLKLVLAGQLGDGVDENDTVFKLLSPLNMASPFARMDLRGTTLTYDRGVYVPGSATPEWFRRFTGSIDDLQPGSDETFTLSCLDRLTLLRPVVSMPAVVTSAPYNAQLTSEFGHDALLRNATNGAISSWPARRPQCVLAAGMRGTIWPEVGTLADAATIGGNQPYPVFAAGAMGTGLRAITLDSTTSTFDNIVYQLATNLGTSLFVEFWVNGMTSTSRHTMSFTSTGVSFDTVSLDIKPTGITITVVGGSGNTFTWSTAISSGSHYIAAAIVLPAVGGTTSSATLYLDGASQATGTLTWGGPRSSTPMNGLWLSPGNGADVPGTIEALQVTTESSPTRNNSFAPQAVLAPSQNTMLVTPAVEGASVDAVRDINSADLSTSGFDELGVYRSTTRASRRGGVSVGSYTSDSSLETVEMQLTSSGYANRVQVPVSTWTFGARALVWSADTIHKIKGHSVGTSFLVNTVDQLVAQVDGTISVRPNGGGTVGNSYFLASTDKNGVSPHNGLTNGTVKQIDATHFLVSFDNTWLRDAYLVAPYTSDLAVGTPCVQIGGIPVTAGDSTLTDSQWPPVAEGGAKSSPQGEVPYVFADNAWRQDADAAQLLGDDTLCEMRRPVWVFTNVSIAPDWRLQLGDRIHLTAPKLFLDDDVVIFGISESMSDGEDTQTLTVRMVAPPGVWVLGLAGRDELGVNIYV